MFNVNPTNSTKLANSIQRDYRQAADAHRLAKESGYQPKNNPIIKAGLTLTTLAMAVATISQIFG